MTHDQSLLQQRLASGQWEEVLKQWAQGFSTQALGLRLAALMQEVMPASCHALLASISSGYRQPDDAVRWHVFEQGKKMGFSTPVGALALSLFWSYGSMTPPEREPVYPDPQLSPQLLHCALVMLVTQLADAPVEGVKILFARCAAKEEA
ncbi:DUF6931 family protein [Pseudescherichia sp.]|uniref:DUF6931 family protein n=1 Tax=Pseudescherichia sp. TaxID=2055881 RepID=UPI0028A0AE3A|nr:hypothetical protein [Pseudescherichia sp.]